MFCFLSFAVVSVIGTVATREPGIDINRINFIPQGKSYSSSYEQDLLVAESSQLRTNDYDDHSSGHYRLPTSISLYVPSLNTKSSEIPLKVHQPREDPRLFYQSDTYLKEINGHHVNNEVSFIYPGRESIRAIQESNSNAMPLRVQDKTMDHGFNVCVRCPHDRTLVARAGSDRVIFQKPRLFSCSGHKAPRNIHLVHMYGPKFGSLLEQGSHLILGRIVYKERSITLCKMQVHVIMQNCATPKYLTSNCKGQNCTFTCRDPKLHLYGQSSLKCGSNTKWTGDLPICRAQNWCNPPSPPEHGRISCKGATVDAGPGLVEGSKCRLRCARGWRRHPHAVTMCRRGAWTNNLSCQRTVFHAEKTKST